MLEPTYRAALSHAWQLVWHYKVVWIFGLLAVLFSQFGISNFVGQVIALDQQSFFAQDYSSFFSLAYWQPIVSGWSLWLLFLVVTLGVLVVLVSVAAEGALIAAASEWFHHRTKPKFDVAWHRGIKHFWRLFAVRVIERVLLGAVLLVVGYLLSRFSQVDSWFNTLYTIVVFAAGFLIAFVVSAIGIYASGYVVHDENALLPAIEKGIMLFRRHVVVSMELSVIELVLSLVVAFLVFKAGFWLLVPSVVMTLIASATGFTTLINFGVFFTLFLFVIMVALVGAIFHSFMVASWIYLFMKMHHEGVVSRVLHWLGLHRV